MFGAGGSSPSPRTKEKSMNAQQVFEQIKKEKTLVVSLPEEEAHELVDELYGLSDVISCVGQIDEKTGVETLTIRYCI